MDMLVPIRIVKLVFDGVRYQLTGHIEIKGMKVNINKYDRVLEVGSGASPFRRSDILLEKYISDGIERSYAKVKISRPLVIGDALSLPFENNSFDYIICRHVLEHVKNPDLLIHELLRVSKKGYIETPSPIWEKLHNYTVHRWFVSVENNKLVLIQKERKIYDQSLDDAFLQIKKSCEYVKLTEKHPEFFLTRFEYDVQSGKPLNYKISRRKVIESFDHAINGVDYKLLDEICQKRFSLYKFGKNIIDRLFFRTRKKFDIYEKIICPICKNKLKIRNENYLFCEECKCKYRIHKNIPVMLKEEAIFD